MNWSAEQQRLLGAMGYQLMARARPGATSQLDASAASAPAPGRAAGPAAAGADAASFPALWQALRRAAGDQDIAGLIADLERLRREPALKRALWPRIRALRRSH